MKLATVNPELDFNNLANFRANDVRFDNFLVIMLFKPINNLPPIPINILLFKKFQMIQICRPVPDSVYQVEMSMTSSHAKQPQQRNRIGSHCFMNMLDPTCHLSLIAHQAYLNGLGDASSQVLIHCQIL